MLSCRLKFHVMRSIIRNSRVLILKILSYPERKSPANAGKKVPTRTRSQLNLAEPRLLRVKAFVALIHGFITPLAPCFASPIAGMSRSP